MALPDRDRVRAVHPQRRQRTLLGGLFAATVLLLAGCGADTGSGDEPPLQTTPAAASTSEEAATTSSGTDPPTASTTEAATTAETATASTPEAAAPTTDAATTTEPTTASTTEAPSTTEATAPTTTEATAASSTTTSEPPTPTTTAPAVPRPEASTVDGLLRLDRPLVIAHAGGDQDYPHSTIYAYTQSAAAGADILELDVQLTADGALIVQHDDTVDRTTEASGRVADLTLAEIPTLTLEWVQSHIESPLVFLLALNLLLIVVGALMDIYSAIVVVVPLIIPLAAAYGIDPVHLGIIFLANMELGYLMPPMGENLFLSAYRFDKPLTEVYRSTLPYVLILLVVVLLITYFPIFTLGPIEFLLR